MKINIDELADRQLNDYRFGNPGTTFFDQDFHIDVKTAYTVQDAVARLRVNQGEKVIGYKVGCTGPGTTKLFGMNGPIRGTLFEDEIHTNGTLLEYRSFYNLAVEAEMAFEIGENNQIISVFPIIELHNFVFRGPKKTLSELIANNGLNKGFILSEKRWRRAPEFYSEQSVISL